MTKHALHNALFAAIITSNRALAIELLKFLLQHEQLAKLDFRTLKFETTVFTDADGNERRADAVVTIQTKDKQQIVLLIEHKSTQDKGLLLQLLTYQVLLETHLGGRVIPIVISNARRNWHIPQQFRDKFAGSANSIGDGVALDFGYLLLHLPDYSQEEIIAMFPKSHPYILPLHCIRDLTDTKIANFFRSSLLLELEERVRLVERATDCFLKFNSALSLSMLENIEAKAIDRLEDRTMERIKLGREGWIEEGMEKGIKQGIEQGLEKGLEKGLEQGIEKGLEQGLEQGIEKGLLEVALRLLEKGISIAEVCDVTKLSRRKVSKLAKQRQKA